MNLRKCLVTVVAILLVASVATVVSASCGGSKAIWNGSSGYQSGMPGVLGTDVHVKFWSAGNLATINSGTLAESLIATSNNPPTPNSWYLFTDWTNGGINGCIANGGRTVVLYSCSNNTYCLMSVIDHGDNVFDFDAVGAAGVAAAVAVPQLSVTGTTIGPNYVATVTWPAIANLKGYYAAADGVPANLITGIAIRYWNGAVAPTDFNTGVWTLSTNGTVSWGAGSDPGTLSNVTFPAPGAGTRTYLAISLLFDGQTATMASRGEALGYGETSFVGGYVQAVFAPTAAALFTSNGISAKQGMVSVDWTTNVEAGIASFEVYYSAQKNGSYVPVAGASALPKGNNSSYLVTFTKPVKGQKLFYKVAAKMTDGTTQWSDLLKIVK